MSSINHRCISDDVDVLCTSDFAFVMPGTLSFLLEILGIFKSF